MPDPATDTDQADEQSPYVRIKFVPFNLAMLALGCDKAPALARKMGVTDHTVRSALDGGNVGEKFMGLAIALFRRHELALNRRGLTVSMDEFFEVPAEVVA
jgi:hypothetical protein